MAWGSGAQLHAYQDLIDLYRQSHPDQAVELIGIPGEADYQRRLAADMAAGRPADVILESYTNVPGLVARGQLTPVAPLLATSRILSVDALASRAVSPFIVGRQLQCVPLSASGLVIYYNKTLFQKASVPEPNGQWTRQAFLEAARALTTRRATWASEAAAVRAALGSFTGAPGAAATAARVGPTVPTSKATTSTARRTAVELRTRLLRDKPPRTYRNTLEGARNRTA